MSQRDSYEVNKEEKENNNNTMVIPAMKEKDTGQEPIFTCRAHVFHIDPKTKKSWVPASNTSVNVSFFFDATRTFYRIISIDGTKAIINSTVTPTMGFTRTAQKFGQWTDIRANTVYGLGFNSESELTKFVEKFNEVKEATRVFALSTNGGVSGGTPPPSLSSANASPVTGRSGGFNDPGLIEPPSMMPTTPGLQSGVDDEDRAAAFHQKFQQNLTLVNESPKHHATLDKNVASVTPVSSYESQLKYENERLKIALAHSSANAKKWEVELATLKNNNLRLTSALQESTANVEEWKKQLQSLKEENQRLKNNYVEFEGSKGGSDGSGDLRRELAMLRLKYDASEMELAAKEEDMKRLTAVKTPYEEKCKMLAQENAELQAALSLASTQLETALAAQETQKRIIETLNAQLAARINDLTIIHREIATTLQT